MTLRHAPACPASTRHRGRDRPRRGPAAPWPWCQRGVVRPEDAWSAMDDPGETEPRLAVCFVVLLRSPPRDVSRLAPWGSPSGPLHPRTGWQARPPTSLPGFTVSRTGAWAPPGAEALHCLGACIRLPTLREVHQHVGGGGLWTPGGSTGASACRAPSRPCPPGRCGAGAAWWRSPRPCHEASHRGFRCLLRPDYVPTVTPCATHRVALSRVRDTSPLPATPPRFGNRGHHTRLEHRSFVLLSLAVKLATSCRKNARSEPPPKAGAQRTLEGVGSTA